MARPTKIGLNYFPLDIDFFDDEKILFVSGKFGLIGEIVTIKLLSRIYRNGYYINWGEDEAILFLKRLGSSDLTTEQLTDIVDELIKRDFFDKDLYNLHGILTSKGIQKRYFEAIKRRKNDNNDFQFVLVGINECNNQVNDSNNSIDSYIGTQTKVNKTKVNKSKVKETTTTTETPSGGSFLDTETVVENQEQKLTIEPDFEDRNSVTDCIKNLFKTYSNKDPDLKADLKPIMEFVYSPNFPIHENYKLVENSFIALHQAARNETAYLIGILRKKFTEAMNLKNKKLKQQELTRFSHEPTVNEVDMCEKYANFFEKNGTLFSDKEKHDVNKALESKSWMVAAMIIEPKMEEISL